jgi:hypothetical protein
MSLKNTLKNAKARACSYSYESWLVVALIVGLLLWPRNFGMTWVAMVTYKTKIRGSEIMDCCTRKGLSEKIR